MYMQEKNSNSRKDKKQTPMEGIAGTATLSWKVTSFNPSAFSSFLVRHRCSLRPWCSRGSSLWREGGSKSFTDSCLDSYTPVFLLLQFWYRNTPLVVSFCHCSPGSFILQARVGRCGEGACLAPISAVPLASLQRDPSDLINWGRTKLLPTASGLNEASHHRE